LIFRFPITAIAPKYIADHAVKANQSSLKSMQLFDQEFKVKDPRRVR
jgi:hypothetical protein